MIFLSVTKIKVLNIIGRMNELDKVTQTLADSGAFHPDNALSFYSDTTGFSPVNEANPYAKPLSTMTDALKLIHREIGSSHVHINGRDAPPVTDWNAYADHFAAETTRLLKRKQESQKNIQSLNAKIETISRFSGLDLDIGEARACKFVKIRFGSLPIESYQKLNEEEYSENPYVAFSLSANDGVRCWGAYCAPIEKSDEIDRIFAGLYFEETPLDDLHGTVEASVEELTNRRKDEAAHSRGIDVEIDQCWQKEKTNFAKLYSWISQRYVYFGIRRFAARYGDNFILTGWIPADREKVMGSRLDRLETVKYAFDDAMDPEALPHSPPVILKNKKLFRPFEFFIDVYGFPSYNEIDPTVFVAITYFVIFGIMFADLGQGLCIALIGWLLWTKKKITLGKVMIPCGISSAIVGTFFGSVFGFEHALDPLYKTVFHLQSKPISVMDSTSVIITFAVALGIILVTTAILTNVIASLKRKQYTKGLFGPNGVAGLVFYVSIILGFGFQLLLNVHVVNTAYVVVFFILPLISMLFSEPLGGLMEGNPNWKPDSWGEFIMQSFFEVFEDVLSFLTNTISFIRVGAFVLVHAGMMMVTFKLAEMTSGVGYILVLLIGNAFVIALEGLLSGVQSLRLEFYEMFSRFYGGAGRPFSPVIVKQES